MLIIVLTCGLNYSDIIESQQGLKELLAFIFNLSNLILVIKN